MIVKCIKRKLADVEDGRVRESLEKVVHLEENEDVGLKIGETYTVYGINLNFFIENMPFYYVCEDNQASYPVPKAAVFFEVVESTLSKHWRFVFELNSSYGLFLPEWASDQGFYERIVDENQHEISLFREYRKIMDDENVKRI